MCAAHIKNNSNKKIIFIVSYVSKKSRLQWLCGGEEKNSLKNTTWFVLPIIQTVDERVVDKGPVWCPAPDEPSTPACNPG
jgi:hypothetical protein